MACASLPGSPALGAAGWWPAPCPLCHRRVPSPSPCPVPLPKRSPAGDVSVVNVLLQRPRGHCWCSWWSTRWDASRGVTEIVLGWFDPAQRTGTENLVIFVYPGLDEPKYVHNRAAATKRSQPLLEQSVRSCFKTMTKCSILTDYFASWKYTNAARWYLIGQQGFVLLKSCFLPGVALNLVPEQQPVLMPGL